MNHKTLVTRIADIMSKVLELREAEITEDLSSGSVASWDSVNHMSLIFAFEEEFGFQFSDEEIVRMSDLKTIVQIIENHGTK